MNKVYMIEILCKDTDNSIYNDNFRKGYSTYDRAKQVLNELVKEEYENLMEMANENTTYYIIDYIEDNREVCEREIYIETKDYENLLTRYTIVAVEIDNTKVRYDMEEKFAINEKMANKINGMIYKGVEVEYVWDTNTILFHKAHKETLNDEDDFDCCVYRNYTEDYLANYIETQLNKFIDDEERNNKTIYHLHNDYGEYNEYTTDENKIIMIYIDEMAQCVENNISMNIEEDEYKSANGWLYKIMMTCGAYSRKTLDINKVIEELNKEHNWLIEVYKKGDE